MATSATSLSSGVQELYNKGLLPTNLSTNTLSKATSTQISQLANSSIASQEVGALFNTSSSSSDSVSLSPTATDALNQAVANQLTLSGTTAANHFLGTSSNTEPTATTGTNVNVIG